MLRFNISSWAGYAAGLHSAAEWRAWAQNPYVPVECETPALADVSAMARRRIDPLGRMAIQVAQWCRAVDDARVPLVFASRYGDITRSHALLCELVDEGAVSPTSFGLSVHNAIAAQYSMLHGDRGNYTALGAGQATPEAALVEAAGLLADGAPEVLVVVYDTVVPSVYSQFVDEPLACYAWAWNVRTDQDEADGIRIGLEIDASAERSASTLPHALDVHRFLIGNGAELTHRTAGTGWRWRRLAHA